MKRFIFVADDFGMSSKINQGIHLAHRAGSFTFVSLMVKQPAIREALDIIRECPKMVVGLHLHADYLMDVDPVIWSGKRDEDLVRKIHDPKLYEAICRECEDQIRTYFSFGFTPTFLNSHYNIHSIPYLFPLFLDLAQRHGFRYMRVPPHTPLLSHSDLPITEKDMADMAERVKKAGISHPDWYEPTFCYFFPPTLRGGLTEIAFHPAWFDSEIGYLDLARLLSWGNIMKAAGGMEGELS